MLKKIRFAGMILLCLAFSAGLVCGQKKAAKEVSIVALNFTPADNQIDLSSSNAIIFESFVQRLKKMPNIKVETESEPTSGEGLDRRKSVERAQSEDDSHIVWVQLEKQNMAARRPPIGLTPDKVYVKYVIFAPQTGEVVAQGRIEQELFLELSGINDMRGDKTPLINNNRLPLGGPRIITETGSANVPSQRYIDIDSLQRAGRETAKRVLKVIDKI